MNLVKSTPALSSLVHHLLGAEHGDSLSISGGGFVFDRSAWAFALGEVGHGASINGDSKLSLTKRTSRSISVTVSGRRNSVTIRLGAVLRNRDPSSSWVGLPFPGAPSIFVCDHSVLGSWGIQALMPTNSTKYLARMRRTAVIVGAKYGLLGVIAPIQLEAKNSPLLDLCRRIHGANDEPTNIVFRLGTGTRNRKTTLAWQAPHGSPDTRVFLQIADVPSANDYVENYARILKRIRTIPSLRNAVPKPIYNGEWRGRQVLAMEGLDVKAEISIGIPQAIIQFLRILYAETGYRAAFVESPFFRWATTLCDQIGEPAQRTIGLLNSALEGSPIPVACCHRDFDYKNAVSSNSEAKVIDWEWARDGWPALIDGLCFLLYRPDVSWQVGGDPKRSCNAVLGLMKKLKRELNILFGIYNVPVEHIRTYLGLLFLDRALNGYEVGNEVTTEITDILLLAGELAGS